MEKKLPIPSHLIKDVDAAHKQLSLYKKNKETKELPKALKGRIEYLVGYINAIRERDRHEKAGTWCAHCVEVANEVNKLFNFRKKK